MEKPLSHERHNLLTSDLHGYAA